ncbi:MAG: vitamin B12 transporter [Polaribacter sp.]
MILILKNYPVSIRLELINPVLGRDSVFFTRTTFFIKEGFCFVIEALKVKESLEIMKAMIGYFIALRLPLLRIFKQNAFMKNICYYTFSLCLLAVSLSAQQSSVLSIDTVELSTTRLPQKMAETGRNISLVKGVDLKKMSFNSLDELLQYIPVIELQSRNGFGVQADISMRGATFTQVLILLDGMKMNDPLTGHFNGAFPITPAEIERIEVLRGPAAALYGPDAVGGVINIISKAFSPQQAEGLEASGQLSYGDHKLISNWMGFSVKKDRLQIVAGVSSNQSDGERIDEKTFEPTDSTSTTLEGYNNYFDVKTISTALSYQLSDKMTISARSAYDYRDFSARYFYTTSAFDKSTETTRTWWNQVQLNRYHDKGKTDLNVAYKFNTDEFIFSPDFASTNNHETKMLNMQLSHLQRINKQISIHGGLQADRRSIVSNDRGDHEDWHFGAYAMTAYQPLPALTLNASIRLDYDENYDVEVSPQLNVAYQFDPVVIRGSIGRSIRAADYTERYVSTQLENLSPGRSLGNPDLLAEQSWSEELGFDVNVSSNWKLKATGFLRQSSELIDYVATNAKDIERNENLREDADYFLATNITDVSTKGLEIESWYSNKIGNVNLLWIAGYTFLNTTNDDDVVSVYISSHARHLVNTNFVLSTPRFEAAVSGLYKMRDPRAAASINIDLQDQYQLWNLRLEWKIVPEFGFNIQVHNLFDEEYQNILGAPMPGRWIMGGLRFDL